MTATLRSGPRAWRLRREQDGHRIYSLTSRVVASDRRDGPSVIINCPGLPLPGSLWQIGNDNDPWAWCTALADVVPVKTEGPSRHWNVTQEFSTKPPDVQRCQDLSIQDPLLEPPKVSGSFIRYTEEATHDRFGNPILTSSHEQIRGALVEFDRNRPQVIIELNYAILDLGLLASFVDTVNSVPMWGLPVRSVKLSEAPWAKLYYGQCRYYYNVRFTFDINVKLHTDGVSLVSGWDRELVDEGTKVLNGHWDDATGLWAVDNIAGDLPDKNNPNHFIRFKDRTGENCKVILDGNGEPYNPDNATTTDCSQCPSGAPVQWFVEGLESYDLGVDLLTHQEACTWEGRSNPSVDSTTITLEYVAADSRWVLSCNSITGTWFLSAGAWSCLGPNVMTKLAGDGPAAVTLTSSGGRAGSIFVQKYLQGNPFIFGIPTVL